MPVKFWHTNLRFWFFLSYLITTVYIIVKLQEYETDPVSSIKPKFDDQFIDDLRILYKLRTWNCFDLQTWQNNFRFATPTQHVNLQKNQSSNFGLIERNYGFVSYFFYPYECAIDISWKKCKINKYANSDFFSSHCVYA